MENVEKVRLLIAEVDTANQIFTDIQLEGYLEIFNQNIFRAAASAIRAIAIDEALLRDVKTDDLQITSSQTAKALMEIAVRLEAQADAAESRESAEFFDIVNGHSYYVPELHTRLARDMGY